MANKDDPKQINWAAAVIKWLLLHAVSQTHLCRSSAEARRVLQGIHFNCIWTASKVELTILFPTLLAKKHWTVPQAVILGRGMVIHRYSSCLHLPSWKVHSGETSLAYGREAGSCSSGQKIPQQWHLVAAPLVFNQGCTAETRSNYCWPCAYLIDEMSWQTPCGKVQQKAFQAVHFSSQVRADAWQGQMWRTAYRERAHTVTALEMYSLNSRNLSSQTTANAPTSLHCPGVQCLVLSTGTVQNV